jgi:hypothetical protein
MEEKLDTKLSTMQVQQQQQLSNLENKLESVNTKLGAIEGLNARCGEMEDQVTANVDDIEGLRSDMSKVQLDQQKLFNENKELRDAIKKLEEGKADVGWVAGIHDEQLRNSLTVCGVAKGPNEKYWTGTKATLAEALEKITPAEYTKRYWIRAIQRAHRGKITEGKIPVIHCKFVSWADLDIVVNLFKGEDAVPNPDGLEFYEKFCGPTDERRKKAVTRRTSIRAQNKEIKAHVRYPADLMVKRPGDKSYTCVQKY